MCKRLLFVFEKKTTYNLERMLLVGKKKKKHKKSKQKISSSLSTQEKEKAKPKEEIEKSFFLENLLRILVYGFVLLGIILRLYVSGIRAELASPMSSGFLGLTYGQERSLHFFVIALLSFGVATYFLRYILEGRFEVLRTSFDLPLVLFLGWCWLSLGWSSHLQTSLHVLLTWTSYLLFFYVLVQLFYYGGKEKILIPLMALGFSLAIFAMIEVWYVYPMAQKEIQGDLKKAKKTYFMRLFRGRLLAREAGGPFITSNIFGSALSLFFLLTLGFLGELLDRKKKSYHQIALAFLALLSIALALYLTRSKGAWLACSFGILLFMLFWQRQRIFKNKKSILLYFGGLFLLISLSIGAIYLLGKGASLEKSLTTRQIYAKGLLKMIKAHPWFGVSIGNFFAYYPAYKVAGADEMIRHGHNDYLQILAEVGIFGFLLYLWFWWAFWKKWGFLMRLEAAGHSFAKTKEELTEQSETAKRSPWPSALGILSISALSFFLLFQFQNTLLGDLQICLFVFLLYSLFFMLFYPFESKNHTYSHSPYPYYFVMLGAGGGLGSFLFHGLGSYVLYSPTIFFMVLLFIAFIAGYGKTLVEEKSKQKFLFQLDLGLGKQLLLFLLIFIWVGILVVGLQTSIQADSLIHKGDETKKKAFTVKVQKKKVELLQKALEYYLEASRFSPLDEKICLAAAKTAELAYGLSGQRKFVDIAKKQYQRALRLGPRN
ncbi:MAG: O-antigen ligase domain-containing protein, partial [Planctomycetota bacterium]